MKDGMIVVAQRCIGGGAICEITLKRLRIIDGKPILMPESTNPTHKPIEVGGIRSEEEVTILDLAVSVQNAL